MRVRCRHDVMAHQRGPSEIFINKKIHEEFEVVDPNLLKELAADVEIVDYFPAKAEYKLLKDFKGQTKGAVITLFSDQAGRLVLLGVAEPLDETLWRPGRSLPHSGKSFLRRIVDEII